MTNVQSLSSRSCVRESLNSVTEIVWLSGTDHEILPDNGATISGSHGSGVDATRRDRRVHTIDKFVGRLKYDQNLIKYVINVVEQIVVFAYRSRYIIQSIFELSLVKSNLISDFDIQNFIWQRIYNQYNEILNSHIYYLVWNTHEWWQVSKVMAS